MVYDLVLLAADGIKAPSLPTGKSYAVEVGDTIYVVGNPRGLVGTFSDGIISSIRKVGKEGRDTLFQITAPISHGSSGGPVVNTKGEVIGVVVATFKSGQNLNFVIPAKYLSKLLDQKKSAEDNRKAADQGDGEAMRSMGTKYKIGIGVPENQRQAVSWYRKAIEKGNVEAMTSLGSMFKTGQGVPQDYHKAVKWYRKAAEKGDGLAMLLLGKMYRDGDGVPKNDKQARHWYRLGRKTPWASEQRHVQSTRQSAEKGDIRGMKKLGQMYYDGPPDVSQDYAEAYIWFFVAAMLGDKDAEKLRDTAESKLTPSEKQAAQSRASELFKQIKKRMAE